MINKLPFIGWFFSFTANVSMSIPFWICWTICGIGSRYFYWLPKVYQVIPFWDCVGLFIVISTIKGSLIPTLVRVNQENKNTTEKEKEEES